MKPEAEGDGAPREAPAGLAPASTPLGAALRMAGIYLLAASLWILFSDQLLGSLLSSPADLIRASMLKGWFFVAVSSLLLFALVFRAVQRERAVQESLRQREARYRLLREYAGDWVFLLDAQGRHLYDSPSCRDITGCSPEDFAADPALLGSLVHPEDRPVFARHLLQEHGTGGLALEFRLFHRDGSLRWLSHDCHPIRDSKGTIIGRRGSTRDITQRKQAELALAQNEHLLRSIVETSTDAIFSKDKEGCYRICNQAAARIMGRQLGEILGHDDRAMFSPDTAAMLMAQDRALMASGEPLHREQEIESVDGQRRHVQVSKGVLRDEQGQVTGLFGISRDISRHVRDTAELKRLNRSLRALSSGNQVLLHAANEAVMLHEFCRVVVEECGYTLAWVSRAEDDPARTLRPVALAGTAPVSLEQLRDSWADSAEGQGPGGTAIREGRPVLCRAHEQHPVCAAWQEQVRGQNILALLALPLAIDGQPWGALNICSGEADAFTAGETALLGDLSRDLSFGLQAFRLRDERERASEALRQSEDRLRTILQAAPIGIGVVRRRIIQQVNLTMSAITGYTPEELQGQPARLVYPDDAEYERVGREKYAQISQQGLGIVETRWRCKNGDLRDILLSSAALDPADLDRGVVFTAMDISERRQAERTMRASERRYQLIIQATSEGFWMIDGNRTTIEVNDSLCAMLGFSREEMLGRSPLDFADAANQDIFRQQMARIESTPHRQYEIELRRRDGSPIPLLFHSTSLIDEDNISRAFAFVTDLTPIRDLNQALKRELQRSQDYLDMVEVLIVALDRDGRITLINRRGCEVLGYDSAELTGQQWFVRCLPQPRGIRELFPLFRQQMAGQAPVNDYVEHHVVSRDGQRHLIAWRTTLLHDADGTISGSLSAGEDITSRRKLELEVQESGRRFQRLLQAAPVPMCHVSRSGNVTYANDRFIALFGWSPQDLPTIAKAWLHLVPEPERRRQLIETWTAAVQQAHLSRSDILAGEHWLLCKNGQSRLVEISGILLDDGTLVTLTDQTERRRAEEELRRLFRAVEQVPNSVVITDIEGAIQYVNPAFEQVTGYSREEALGQNPRILRSGQQEEPFYRQLWQTITSGQTWRGQLVNKRKDGSLYTEDAVVSPVRNAQGEIINFVAVKRDISEELRLEREHDSLQQQLQQAQKLESVGRLAGGVAHDFNNKLGVILGYVEMASMRQIDDEQLRRALEQIRIAAEQSAALTRQLLAFARKQTASPKVLNLNETVAGMLQMLRRLIGENIKLAWLPGADLWPVRIDPSQVDQILANLAVNARDAIGGVGLLTIETANISLDATASTELPEGRAGDFVQLTVSDSGCGMPAEVLEHIFEPFFTTKEQGKGTGLGLATVFGIVKQNDGLLAVRSRAGQGSSFCILLPRHGAAAEQAEAAVAVALPRGTECVLLVEDEPTMLQLTQELLQAQGYRVLPADGPLRALELARQEGSAIDLLLTDVIMPEMNGRALAEQLQALVPGLKVLFMSGYTADIIAEQGVLDSGVQFLQKPFQSVELARTVRQMLDRESG